jgi:ribosomal protein S18 acetylase RimI-like enzyme
VDDAALKHSTWRSVAAFQRLFGLHAPDAQLLEHPDFVASSVPASFSSLVNAAVPIDGAAIAPHLHHIADLYARAGVTKWGVWIDPAATSEAQALQEHGLVLDSTPGLMAADIKAIEHGIDANVDQVTLEELGAVNDASYGIPPGTIAGAIAGIPPTAVHAYGVRNGDAPTAVAVIQDVEDDAFVSFVATLPDHRGRGLASQILSHAVHQAEQRGQRTTSLQASRLGQSIYARLGYHRLGEIHLYEMRPK